jgi:hypothetical protein
MLFCALQLTLWTYGVLSAGPIEFHLPAQTGWDALFAVQAGAFHWISRWNSLATLLATGLFISTLVRPRWRGWSGLSLVPWAVLLCADFTLRLHPILLP